MKNKLHHIVTRIKWVIIVSFLTACIEKVSFKIPRTETYLVVEGLITDQPGPHTVKISRSFTTDKNAYSNSPVEGAMVLLYSDDVFLEQLEETSPGVYQTVSVTGIVGRTYFITIETKEGKHYVSEPELMRPVGAVTDIRAEFEARTTVTPTGQKRDDRFNVYVDGTTTSQSESFARWRTTGTYQVETQPQFAYVRSPMGVRTPTPAECSGYEPGGLNGIVYVKPCTCCTCWITERWKLWRVASSSDYGAGGYKNIFVGPVAINNLTFMVKYHVNVEQMSLSPKAYDFLRQLTAQTEGVQSLFQPATGEIRGNITAIDSDDKVLGLFYASSINSRSIVLTPKHVPYTIQPPDTIRYPCTTMLGSSTVQPDFW